VRTAARILVVDPADRILLFCARDPADGRKLWFVPGGGLEAGESLLAAARRELAEEVAPASSAALHGPVWRRRHTFSWNGRHIDQTDYFFVARVETVIDAADLSVGGQEQSYFVAAKWASLHELPAPADLIAPSRLADLLPPILAGDYPAEPIDTGS